MEILSSFVCQSQIGHIEIIAEDLIRGVFDLDSNQLVNPLHLVLLKTFWFSELTVIY